MIFGDTFCYWICLSTLYFLQVCIVGVCCFGLPGGLLLLGCSWIQKFWRQIQMLLNLWSCSHYLLWNSLWWKMLSSPSKSWTYLVIVNSMCCKVYNMFSYPLRRMLKAPLLKSSVLYFLVLQNRPNRGSLICSKICSKNAKTLIIGSMSEIFN